MKNMQGIKKITFNLALLLISLFLFFLFFELILRLFYPQMLSYFSDLTDYDPELGWKLKTNLNTKIRTQEFNMDIMTNSEGFRGQEFLKKQNKTIIILGDSMVFGYGVNFNETFVHLVSNNLQGKYDVFGLGAGGYGTDQELLILKEYITRLNPEKVILVINLNDFLNNAGAYSFAQRPLFFLCNESYSFLYAEYQNESNFKKIKLNWTKSSNLFLAEPIKINDKLINLENGSDKLNFKIRRYLLTHSHAYVFIKSKIKNLLARLKTSDNNSYPELKYYNFSIDETNDYNLKLTFTLLDEINYLVRKNNAELLILFIPYKDSLVIKEGKAPNELIKRYSKRENITFIDTFSDFQNSSEKIYYEYDGHPNPLGHKIIVDSIGLVENLQLPKP